MIHLVRKTCAIRNGCYRPDDRDRHYLLRVRRLRPGDEFTCSDGTILHTVRVDGDGRDVDFCIEESVAVTPPRNVLTAVIPLADLSAVESAIVNCVQAGAHHIRLVRTRFSNTSLKAVKKKRRRHETLVLQSSSQSRRLTIPTLEYASFDDLLSVDVLHIVLHPEWAGTVADDTSVDDDTVLWTGPEGGFSPEEIELFKQRNAVFIRFRTPILRMENAVTVGVGVVRDRGGSRFQSTVSSSSPENSSSSMSSEYV